MQSNLLCRRRVDTQTRARLEPASEQKSVARSQSRARDVSRMGSARGTASSHMAHAWPQTPNFSPRKNCNCSFLFTVTLQLPFKPTCLLYSTAQSHETKLARKRMREVEARGTWESGLGWAGYGERQVGRNDGVTVLYIRARTMPRLFQHPTQSRVLEQPQPLSSPLQPQRRPLPQQQRRPLLPRATSRPSRSPSRASKRSPTRPVTVRTPSDA
jgi:hypothetical protein